MRPKPILPTALHKRFWDVEEVSADDALLDKCDVVIGGWSFDAKRHQVASLVPRLSQLEVPCGNDVTTRLFDHRTADDNRYSHTLTVRGTGSGEGVQYPHPTFSGALKLRETSRDKGDQYTKRNWEGIFFAYLNLNRSLQSQTLARRGEGSLAQWTHVRPYNLAISENAKAKIRERLFAPSDNILDRSKKRTEYALSKPAEEHFGECVSAIFQTVQNAIDRRPIEIVRYRQPTITFKTLEVCWDFFDKQPILTVSTIKYLVQSISQRLKVRYFPEFRMEEGLDYNSPSVMVSIVDGIAIRFYAKTETTIRVEVIYAQSAINAAADVSGIHTLSEAVSIIDAVKRDAAEKVNTLILSQRNGELSSEDHATVDELIGIVAGAAPNARIAVSLLTMLACHRRIAPFSKDPMYAQLRALKRAGVLMNEARSPRRRNYVVTPRFRRARDMLLSSYVIPLHRTNGNRAPRRARQFTNRSAQHYPARWITERPRW